MPVAWALQSRGAESGSPETPAFADILRLKILFSTLCDERVAGRVKHLLPEVLLAALCVMVSDYESYTDMASFARSQLDWLRQFIPLRNGPPSHDVFRSVFIALQPGPLLEIMELWGGQLDGKHVAIDGKVSRGAKDSTTGRSILHILRAWGGEAGLSVGHEVCAEKGNELEALPGLLGKLQIHGATVSIDAMGGHPDIAKLARFESLRQPVDETRTRGGWAEGCEMSTTREQNRGRYEQREVVVVREMDWWPRSWKWSGLQSIICVRRETMRHRHSAEGPVVEMHSYLSSRKASAAELGRLIRNHWSVENKCHHLLDVTFREDHCQVRDKTAAHNLTLLRERSAKVLKNSPVKGSLRSKRKRCAHDPAFRAEVTLPIFHGFGA